MVSRCCALVPASVSPVTVSNAVRSSAFARILSALLFVTSPPSSSRTFDSALTCPIGSSRASAVCVSTLVCSAGSSRTSVTCAAFAGLSASCVFSSTVCAFGSSRTSACTFPAAPRASPAAFPTIVCPPPRMPPTAAPSPNSFAPVTGLSTASSSFVENTLFPLL